MEVQISTTNRRVDLLSEGIDFAVRHGLGRYPGLESECLLNDRLQPVCSPRLIPQTLPLSSPLILPGIPCSTMNIAWTGRSGLMRRGSRIPIRTKALFLSTQTAFWKQHWQEKGSRLSAVRWSGRSSKMEPSLIPSEWPSNHRSRITWCTMSPLFCSE